MASVSALFCAFLASLLFTAVWCHLPLVVPSTVVEGEPFTVHCEAGRVTFYTGFSNVFRLEIFRTKSNLRRTTRIADYHFNHLKHAALPTTSVNNKDGGRDWNFAFTGYNGGVNNRDTMQIMWQVFDTKCEDAGKYTCRLGYLSDSFEHTRDNSMEVTVNVNPSMNLTVDPDSNEHQYSDGEIVTFTCRTRNFDELQFKWEKWIVYSSGTEQMESLPTDAVIDTKSDWSSTSDTGCDFYEMESTLAVPVSTINQQETYKCIVSNYKGEVDRRNITIVNSQQQQPVVVPSTVVEGQPFSVYCDASRVLIQDPGFSDIFLLELYKKVTPADSNNSRIAVYHAKSPEDSPQSQGFNPYQIYWSFTFTGDNGGVNNTDTMRIVGEARVGRCDDEGVYSCRVGYLLNGLEKFATKSVNVLSEADTTNFRVEDSSSQQHSDGENVTLQCFVEGPDGMKFKWEKWVTSSSGREQLESLPDDAVIEDRLLSHSAASRCRTYYMLSKLHIRAQHTYRQEIYKCIVSKNNQELIGGNITIDVSPNQRPILDVDDVMDVDTFTITCDISRVIIPPSKDRPISISELAIEARLGSSETFHKIAQYAACGPLESLEYQNNTPGRDWVFNFTGANSGDNNIMTMRIAIKVRDPKYTDAGLYRCTVRYFSDQGGVVGVSQEHNLTALVKPIVKGDIERMRPFTLTCDARRVAAPGLNPLVVGALVIKAKLIMSQTYTTIAEYLLYGPQENLQFKNPPLGSAWWVITFTGSNNGVNNSKTMRLDIEVEAAIYADTGMYMCQVMFYSSEEGTIWLQQEQNVTVC